MRSGSLSACKGPHVVRFDNVGHEKSDVQVIDKGEQHLAPVGALGRLGAFLQRPLFQPHLNQLTPQSRSSSPFLFHFPPAPSSAAVPLAGLLPF